uniref:Uncharacterized protein n=1 Tax=Leersia perrieri TaxID=77586 RepID=A0A0D9WJ80_9ORYZ
MTSLTCGMSRAMGPAVIEENGGIRGSWCARRTSGLEKGRLAFSAVGPERLACGDRDYIGPHVIQSVE